MDEIIGKSTGKPYLPTPAELEESYNSPEHLVYSFFNGHLDFLMATDKYPYDDAISFNIKLIGKSIPIQNKHWIIALMMGLDITNLDDSPLHFWFADIVFDPTSPGATFYDENKLRFFTQDLEYTKYDAYTAKSLISELSKNSVVAVVRKQDKYIFLLGLTTQDVELVRVQDQNSRIFEINPLANNYLTLSNLAIEDNINSFLTIIDDNDGPIDDIKLTLETINSSGNIIAKNTWPK